MYNNSWMQNKHLQANESVTAARITAAFTHSAQTGDGGGGGTTAAVVAAAGVVLSMHHTYVPYFEFDCVHDCCVLFDFIRACLVPSCCVNT